MTTLTRSELDDPDTAKRRAKFTVLSAALDRLEWEFRGVADRDEVRPFFKGLHELLEDAWRE